MISHPAGEHPSIEQFRRDLIDHYRIVIESVESRCRMCRSVASIWLAIADWELGDLEVAMVDGVVSRETS